VFREGSELEKQFDEDEVGEAVEFAAAAGEVHDLAGEGMIQRMVEIAGGLRGLGEDQDFAPPEQGVLQQLGRERLQLGVPGHRLPRGLHLQERGPVPCAFWADAFPPAAAGPPVPPGWFRQS